MSWWRRLLWRQPETVSEAWRVDQTRREFSAGVDQVGVQRWPIDKARNEASQWNTRRLRKRA